MVVRSPDAKPATKSLPSVDCSPLGTSSLMTTTANSVIQVWPYNHDQGSEMSTDSGPTSDEDDTSYPDSDESRQEHCPWDEWDVVAQGLDPSNVKHCTVCIPSATTVPRMPLVLDPLAWHRAEIGLSCCIDSLCVASPVGKAAVDRALAAKA